jgi:hypothetical protein
MIRSDTGDAKWRCELRLETNTFKEDNALQLPSEVEDEIAAA